MTTEVPGYASTAFDPTTTPATDTSGSTLVDDNRPPDAAQRDDVLVDEAKADPTVSDAAPVEDREYVTVSGTTITVVDGVTVAVDRNGSQYNVDGDHYDNVVAVAKLLNL